MGTKRIDELTAATALTADDLLVTMDAATTTKKITAANARTYFTPDAASDTAAGVVELATSAETITGTDAARAVTPAGLAAAATAGAWAGGASDPLDGNALIAQRIFIR